MISYYDSGATIEKNKYYIIVNQQYLEKYKKSKFKLVKNNFIYRSDLNDKKLSINQIKEITEKKNQMIQQQLIQNVQQLNNINKHVEKILQEHKQLINILIKDNVELKNRVCVLENNLKL
jgi:hypothetical protein